MMYVQEVTPLATSDDISDLYINPAAVDVIRPTGSADRCIIVLRGGVEIIAAGSAVAMQAWWYAHAHPVPRVDGAGHSV